MSIKTLAERVLCCERMTSMVEATRMRSPTIGEQAAFDADFRDVEAFDRAEAMAGDRAAHHRVLAYDSMQKFDPHAPAYGSCCGPVSVSAQRGRVSASSAPPSRPPDPRDAVLASMRASVSGRPNR